MFHYVGFIDSTVELKSIIMPCFAAGDGFNIFMWPLRGVLLEYSFSTLHSSEECTGIGSNNVLSEPVIFLLGENAFFVLRLLAQPFSGLVGKVDSPPFLLLTRLSRLASDLDIFRRCL